MELTALLCVVAVAYGVLFFLDSFFRSCMHYPYLALLEGTGIRVGLLHVSWRTTAFNRPLRRWAARSPRLLQRWFAVGTLVTLLLLPAALLLVARSAGELARGTPADSQRSRGPVLESALPGVNLPAADLGFYLFALIASSGLHELGHALAAAQHDVPLLHIGFRLVFILPVAFVVMNNDRLHSLTAWSRLKVYSAGIWHNAVLTLLAYLLYLSVPMFFGCAYRIGHGVRVVDISADSPLYGPKGVDRLDTVTAVNGCPVLDRADWEECLLDVLSEQWGVCVSSDFVRRHDESVQTRHSSDGVLECCEKLDGRNLCFEYLEPARGTFELPQHVCLPVRRLFESKFDKCRADEAYSCPVDYHCVKPLLQNSTSLMIIRRVGKPDVLYIGHPFDVYHTVVVSQYIPKTEFFKPNVPEGFEKAMKYVIMFSTGLAVVNVLPCFVFDGQYIIQMFLQLLLGSRVKHQSLRNVSFCVTLISTVVLVIVFGGMHWKQLT